MPSEKEVRRLVEEAEGPVDDEHWTYALAWVQQAQDEMPGALNELRAQVRKIRAHFKVRGQPVPAGEVSRTIPLSRGSRIPERTKLLARYLAKIAVGVPEVTAFRSRYLGNTLDPESALAFLQPPALRFLQPGEFDALGIPPLGHSSRLLEVSPPARAGGRNWKERVHRVRLEIEWPKRTLIHEFGYRQRVFEGKPFEPLPSLVVPTSSTTAERLSLFPMTVMDELRKAAMELTTRYPWKEDDAVWFVLTGETPPIYPVEVQLKEGGAPRFLDSVDPQIVWSAPGLQARQVDEGRDRKSVV